MAGLDVVEQVAHHRRPRQVQAVRPRGAGKHPRRGLAAQAAGPALRIGRMRADRHVVERHAEVVLQAPHQRRLQPGELDPRERAAGDAALVGDQHQRQPRGLQPGERLAGARHQAQPRRIGDGAVVRDRQRAVLVEEDGGTQPRARRPAGRRAGKVEVV